MCRKLKDEEEKWLFVEKMEVGPIGKTGSKLAKPSNAFMEQLLATIDILKRICPSLTQPR